MTTVTTATLTTNLPQLWPTGFALREVPDASPLSSIWVIGDPGTGKSTFCATIPAENALVLDVEGSYTTLQFLSAMTRIDLRAKAETYLKAANGVIEHALFLAFWEEIGRLEAAKHDLLVIDPFSDLYFGSFFFVGAHPEMFGKSAARYGGKEGQTAQWADARTLWKSIIKGIEAKVQTVVLTSHVKDVYDKATGNKTGERQGRGADITDAVSLKLWLFNANSIDPNGNKPGSSKFTGCNWGLVVKSRLTWHSFPPAAPTEAGKKPRKQFPRISPILPAKLIPEPGQGYPEMIYNFMEQPSPDYGELNVVQGDPTEQVEGDAQAKLRVLELEAQAALMTAKKEMAQRLVGEKLYADGNDIARAIIELKLDEDTQHIEKLLNVESQLRLHRSVDPNSVVEA